MPAIFNPEDLNALEMALQIKDKFGGTVTAVTMGLPILVSRSGFSAWGVELARQANLTLIGRAKGKRMTVLSGHERLLFDTAEDTGT